MRIIATLGLAAVVLVASCKKKDDGAFDFSAASQGLADSSDSNQAEAGLFFVGTQNVDQAQALVGLTGDILAAFAAAHAGERFASPACVTATAAGSVVTYLMNDCTGPYGLVHVTGTATLTFGVDGETITVAAAATDLMVNGALLDVSANATLVRSGTARTLTVTSMTSGVGSRGHLIDHEGGYSLAWADDGSQCLALDGSWSTTIDGEDTWSTTVTNLARCGASCPTSGTIVHTGVGGVTFTFVFDGSATATWTTSGARGTHTGTVPLLCTP